MTGLISILLATARPCVTSSLQKRCCTGRPFIHWHLLQTVIMIRLQTHFVLLSELTGHWEAHTYMRLSEKTQSEISENTFSRTFKRKQICQTAIIKHCEWAVGTMCQSLTRAPLQVTVSRSNEWQKSGPERGYTHCSSLITLHYIDMQSWPRRLTWGNTW